VAKSKRPKRIDDPVKQIRVVNRFCDDIQSDLANDDQVSFTDFHIQFLNIEFMREYFIDLILTK